MGLVEVQVRVSGFPGVTDHLGDRDPGDLLELGLVVDDLIQADPRLVQRVVDLLDGWLVPLDHCCSFMVRPAGKAIHRTFPAGGGTTCCRASSRSPSPDESSSTPHAGYPHSQRPPRR